MLSDELKRYLRKRINTLIRELSTPKFERNEETFHQVRVEIKKIKALYELINSFDKNFHKKKSLKTFKELFFDAGRVRSFHIEEKVISGFGLTNSNKKLLSAIHKKQDKAIRKFENVIRKKLVKQIEKNGEETEKFLKGIKEKDLTDYYKKELAKTEKLIKQKFNIDQLHKTRMMFKELLYNLKLLLASGDKLVIHLDKLQELIGDWHDHVSVLRYLDKTIVKDKLTDEEVKHLRHIRANTVKKKNNLINKISAERIRLRKIDFKPYVK
jgi:CHAD domain-containing protein